MSARRLEKCLTSSVGTPTINTRGLSEFTIDFGSAPLAAFDELVEGLHMLGVRRMTLNSPHVIEE